MPTKPQLQALVAQLRDATSTTGLTAKCVAEATAQLAKTGYSYNTSTLPELPANHAWGSSSSDCPRTLAEALLWKMGKWATYKSFASHYADENSRSKGTDVVFYAFAKHLKDQENPIYDQHALRALWAIDAGLSEAERRMCRSLLFYRSGKWKPFANGREAVNCYNVFVARIAKLSTGVDAASKKSIDRLLMPLGQALKASTSSFDALCALCGWRQ